MCAMFVRVCVESNATFSTINVRLTLKNLTKTRANVSPSHDQKSKFVPASGADDHFIA